MSADQPPGRFVGAQPWLPWPLARWRWWTEPVRAEKLAILRIGLAVAMLVDYLTTYWPCRHDFFGADALGNPEMHGWYGKAPRLFWSVLRGFSDPALSSLVLLGLLGMTAALVISLVQRLTTRLAGNAEARNGAPPYSWPPVLWVGFAWFYLLGFWGRQVQAKDNSVLMWAAPIVLWVVSMAFWTLDKAWRRHAVSHPPAAAWRLIAWFVMPLAVVAGFALFWLGGAEGDWPKAITSVLGSWQNHPALIDLAMVLLLAAMVFLLLGWWTRPMAFMAWFLSTSFANINPAIDNAGDTIRGIILFYLMLCPCGAAWSLDAWRQRRRNGDQGPAYVSPWPLRLLFLQLTLIYCMNGLYKLTGGSWPKGETLHYVLCDLTLTRFSYAQLPFPYWLTKVMTWVVLVWEVAFPLLVCFRWTRGPALVFGVLFHLGIFFTMELGFFVPYILTLYLPLLPWPRDVERVEPQNISDGGLR